MTQHQIAFARAHDWFLGVTKSGRVICRDCFTNRDGEYFELFVSFTDFRKMRDWAGY